MTVLGDELTKALNEKKNDINSYIWIVGTICKATDY